ncbi:unnamed protein product [Arabidopsis thaliana]|uniref:START (StAR-related lipid-transfer) lipid-binding domain-containing protein n=3 Tax=Arabidopsis TaxID=3701 RepID=Q84JD1_ARATH|nr:START (StAR-related lipid-transfer) lipid-binding domain-containing protein [Arabidopsis thaliana]KAG7608425.1 START domain [Arabidopsis suecica]AAO42017.1 unknown protein [Arabidopsis thaliana]AAO50664.1 unknown protein [Arabidopsis thaliana]AED91129.1 START (StAR-related lipid-transfer) lipid-binding domain-containing protein [Arabidopsis thaliana]VYS66143.1 unnamed protein product [Arabidopsis thaliana]|eukprot:NP_196343.2 START (StAR-related lipid-transfer) lipid-binding domain-containing protein [Arabidopsis thaliana]
MYHHLQTRIFLHQQNDLLRAENRARIHAMTSPSICRSCEEPIISTEERELWLENARLRSEIDTLTCFIWRLNSFRNLYPAFATSLTEVGYGVAVMTSLSLKEVVFLARQRTPMWTSNGRLNLDEYYSKLFPWYARNAPGFVHEVSRASAFVPCDASSLVANLMNHVSWQKIFPSIIADVSVESQQRGLQKINVNFMPQISPLIQTRNVKLLRRSRHIEDDTWAIAEISMYFSSYAQHLRPEYMRFPSGYLIQHIANGISKVTILDHWVYKEEEGMNTFNSNSEFGAQRWLTALQKHYYNTCPVSIPSIGHNIQIFDQICRKNLLNLSSFMVNVFCSGVCGITGQRWNRLNTVGVSANNIRMFTQESRGMSGIPCVLVSATGLARMHTKPEVMFGLINGAEKQEIWSYLESAKDMKELIRIGRHPNSWNEVSVFSIEWKGSKEWYLIQETYYDESGAMIIHTCVEAPYFAAAINGGDLSGVELLPSGFTIIPCESQECFVTASCYVKADQTMVTSPNELGSYMENMVTNILGNVQNALPVHR